MEVTCLSVHAPVMASSELVFYRWKKMLRYRPNRVRFLEVT